MARTAASDTSVDTTKAPNVVVFRRHAMRRHRRENFIPAVEYMVSCEGGGGAAAARWAPRERGTRWETRNRRARAEEGARKKQKSEPRRETAPRSKHAHLPLCGEQAVKARRPRNCRARPARKKVS